MKVKKAVSGGGPALIETVLIHNIVNLNPIIMRDKARVILHNSRKPDIVCSHQQNHDDYSAKWGIKGDLVRGERRDSGWCSLNFNL